MVNVENIPADVKKIMIVDDDPAIVQLLSEALKSQGYIIKKTYSGMECLQKVNDFKPDMILLDVMMPKMDGWEVLDELGNRGFAETSKIAMLTTRPLTEKDTSRINFAHLVHYMNKPIVLKDFFQDIDDIFREELMVAQETKKLAEFGGEQFGESYGEILTQNLRKRRIFSNFLNTGDSLDILKTHVDLEGLIKSTEAFLQELDKVKVYFNPIVYFFCFGIEKELERVKIFAESLLMQQKSEK